MPLTPHLTLIRTAEIDLDVYSEIAKRIGTKAGDLRGILLHFAGRAGGELFVVTAYRDASSMREVFNMVSGPAIAEAASAAGRSLDVTHHELKIERLWAADGLEPMGEQNLTEPHFAFVFNDPRMTREIYEQTVDAANFPEQWPSGLMTHLLSSQGSSHAIIDIWNDQEAAEAHYAKTIVPNASKSAGVEDPQELAGDNRINLRSLSINLTADDPMRRYG